MIRRRADTRVYELPGTDFASYRWGNTVDPITPGLIDRPYVARELIPYGTPPSADLLNAFDLPLQEGSDDPAALAPLAQLMGVGTIAHRGDLQFERFRTPRPDATYRMLTEAPGLREVAAFGQGVDNTPSPELPLDDEVRLGEPADTATAPAVSLFDLEDPRDIARTVSASTPTLLAGDGAGIVAWARSGGLDPDRAILYSASFADDPDGLDELLSTPGSQLVVTDSNRRQGRRWGSVRENDGYTERAGEEPLVADPADNRLEKFPGAGDESFTLSEQRGGATLSASAYGNPVSYTPSDRAARAMDGDPSTAWRVAAFDEPRGEFLEVEFDEPVTAAGFNLLQRQPTSNRWITEVELSFDDADPLTVGLGAASLEEPGQFLEFGQRTFQKLRVTITDSNVGRLDRYIGFSDVGIAELTIDGVGPVSEVIRPPTDLLEAAGTGSIDHPLTYVFTRRSANPGEVVVNDEEGSMMRIIQGPVARGYTVFGSAQVAVDAAESTIDSTIGLTPAGSGGVTATSSSRLAGDPRSRAASALDGDPDTAWQTPLNSAVGASIDVVADAPFAFDGFDFVLRNDGLHSVPTQLRVTLDDAEPITVDVPTAGVAPAGSTGYAATEAVSIPMDPTEVRAVHIEVARVAEANSSDWFSGQPTQLPVAIAELGLDIQLPVPPDSTPLASPCRDDLLSVDAEPIPVRVEGTVGDYLDGRMLPFAACNSLDIAAGEAVLETYEGASSGFDLEQVVLASAAGGSAGADTLVTGPEPMTTPPSAEVRNTSRLNWEYSVEGAREPYWVVLGQSFSPGFVATTGDGTDLGEPTLINGYANGWLVDPEEVGADATINVEWTPQRLVWIGMALSVAWAGGLCRSAHVEPASRSIVGGPATGRSDGAEPEEPALPMRGMRFRSVVPSPLRSPSAWPPSSWPVPRWLPSSPC